MRTSAALRTADLVPGTPWGSKLPQARLHACGTSWSVAHGSSGDGSKRLEQKCHRFAPPKPSSLPSDIRSNWSTEGSSSAGARRLQFRALEGQTSFATFKGEPTTPCDSCQGKGWLVCDFCGGQKVNVQAKNNRIYRRCPSCRAAGVVICPRCKVFKCVSYPDEKDTGMEL